MKKRTNLTLTEILYMVFGIGTVISFFIVYKDIDSRLTFGFLAGYIIYTFFLLIYIPLDAILKLRKYKWIEVRRRLLKFILLFTLFSTLNYVISYFSKSLEVDPYWIFFSALGLSFGISFSDVGLSKGKNQ